MCIRDRIGPIIAAFTFTDDLAVLGTNVEEISQLLNAEELNHKETPVKLEDTGISLRSVSFSYDGTTEDLHDVNLAIHPRCVYETALLHSIVHRMCRE